MKIVIFNIYKMIAKTVLLFILLSIIVNMQKDVQASVIINKVINSSLGNLYNYNISCYSVFFNYIQQQLYRKIDNVIDIGDIFTGRDHANKYITINRGNIVNLENLVNLYLPFLRIFSILDSTTKQRIRYNILQFYKLFQGWKNNENNRELETDVNNIAKKITVVLKESIKSEIIDPSIITNKLFNDCKKTFSLAVEPSLRYIHEEIMNLQLPNTNPRSNTEVLFSLEYAYILQLMTEVEFNKFIKLDVQRQKLNLILILKEALKNAFVGLSCVLSSLNTIQDDYVLLLKNMHTIVLETAEKIYEISDQSKCSSCLHAQSLFGNQFYEYNQFITFFNTKWIDMMARNYKEGNPVKISEYKALSICKISDKDLLTIYENNSYKARISSIRYYELHLVDPNVEEYLNANLKVKFLADLKVWILLLKKFARDFLNDDTIARNDTKEFAKLKSNIKTQMDLIRIPPAVQNSSSLRS